ncbi:MAG: type II toxin-antitoxin system VapC family toxin [Candidatus Nanohalobium sp.]
MKLFFDSSVIVEIDRGNKEVRKLMKRLVREEHEILISSVTVAEIMTGAYRKGKVKETRKVLGQFQWIEMNGKVADRAGEMMAQLYEDGKPIEFQDVAIAASAEEENSKALITSNTEHFKHIETDVEVQMPEKLQKEV